MLYADSALPSKINLYKVFKPISYFHGFKLFLFTFKADCNAIEWQMIFVFIMGGTDDFYSGYDELKAIIFFIKLKVKKKNL